MRCSGPTSASGSRRRPHHQRAARLMLLGKRQVVVRPRLLAEHHVLAVARRCRRPRSSRRRRLKRNRWPTASFPGHSFVAMVSFTSPTCRAVSSSVRSSVRPREQPSAGRLEEPRPDDVEGDGEVVVLGAGDLAVDADFVDLDAVVERHVHGRLSPTSRPAAPRRARSSVSRKCWLRSSLYCCSPRSIDISSRPSGRNPNARFCICRRLCRNSPALTSTMSDRPTCPIDEQVAQHVTPRAGAARCLPSATRRG